MTTATEALKTARAALEEAAISDLSFRQREIISKALAEIAAVEAPTSEPALLQWRFSDVHPQTVMFGECGEWITCDQSKYDEISHCRDNGYPHYEVRKLYDHAAPVAAPAEPVDGRRCPKCHATRGGTHCWKCSAETFQPDPRCGDDPHLPPIDRIRELAKEVGYAIGVHGSQQRDFDVIAAPWSDMAVGNHALLAHIAAGLTTDNGPARIVSTSRKPLGRYAATIQMDGWFKQLDISVCPSSTYAAIPFAAPVEPTKSAIGMNDLIPDGWEPDANGQLRAKSAEPARCTSCDGTGQVHSADGEWMGPCTCGAEPAPAEPVAGCGPNPVTWTDADKSRLDAALHKTFGTPAPVEPAGAAVDERAAFEAWAETKYPLAMQSHSLGAYSRGMKKCAKEGFDFGVALTQQLVPAGRHADLTAIDAAMQHMGDALNSVDAVEDGDEGATKAGFEAIARLLAAAPTSPGEPA